MKIRHIYLNDEDRKRLLELVEEAAAEIDQIDSDEELDQLEAELSEQLQKIVEEDETEHSAYHLVDKTHAFKKKTTRYMALPGFALVAVVVLSVVGNQSLPETDPVFLSKGQTAVFPCDLQVVQACGAGGSDFHIEDVLVADVITMQSSQPVYFRASCPAAESLTIQDTMDRQIILSDPVPSQMAVLTSKGQSIQWQPVETELRFTYGDSVMTVKVQSSSDVCHD
ncbi:MAG: hypothetical protein ACOH5I_16100 [Oligoflexus sp.]